MKKLICQNCKHFRVHYIKGPWGYFPPHARRALRLSAAQAALRRNARVCALPPGGGAGRNSPLKALCEPAAARRTAAAGQTVMVCSASGIPRRRRRQTETARSGQTAIQTRAGSCRQLRFPGRRNPSSNRGCAAQTGPQLPRRGPRSRRAETGAAPCGGPLGARKLQIDGFELFRKGIDVVGCGHVGRFAEQGAHRRFKRLRQGDQQVGIRDG